MTTADPKRLDRIATFAILGTRLFIGAQIAVSAFLAWQSLAYRNYFQSPTGGAALATVEYIDSFANPISTALIVAMVFAYTVNARWLYVASYNAAIAQPDPARISAGWAVGWYAIPIANWFMPYKAMKQTWAASVGLVQQDSTAVPRWFAVWWGGWVLLNIWESISGELLSSPSSSDETWLMLNMSLAITGLLWFVPSMLFIRIIREVTAAQFNQAAVFE